jgi:hypothetical protein
VRLILGVDAENRVQQAESACEWGREMATSHCFNGLRGWTFSTEPIVDGNQRSQILSRFIISSR